MLLQFACGMEGPGAPRAAGDQGKEALELIEPRTAGWREVELEPFSLLGLEPSGHPLFHPDKPAESLGIEPPHVNITHVRHCALKCNYLSRTGH